jgi:putative copper export protein
MSTILIIFQAYILSFDLGLDLSSTFIILLSSSVGNIFIIKLITSVFIIALGILHYYICKRFKNQILTIIGDNKSTQEQQEQNYIKQNLKNRKISLSFCITILVLGSINIFSNSIQSHNAAVDFFPNIAISVDWLHFIMVSIWVGGLFYISITLSKKLFIKNKNSFYNNHHQMEEESSINFSRDAITIQFFLSTILRFSFIAVVSLGIIFITGLYMAVLHIQQPSSFLNSIYGNILILKLIIVFFMAAFGTYHYFKIPILINQKSETTKLNQLRNFKRFNKTMKIEYILGIGIIFISSFLTITSPPHHESYDMNIIAMTHSEDLMTQNITNSYNLQNYFFYETFPLIAFTISILIAIVMILAIKKSWTNIKLYNQSKQTRK